MPEPILVSLFIHRLRTRLFIIGARGLIKEWFRGYIVPHAPIHRLRSGFSDAITGWMMVFEPLCLLSAVHVGTWLVLQVPDLLDDGVGATLFTPRPCTG